MPVDQWLERWADAQIKEIEKVDDTTKERCSELSKNLREVELELISVTAAVQQLRATVDSISEDLGTTSIQLTDMIRKNSDDILRHMTACPHQDTWKLVWNRLSKLEIAEHKREGSGKWEMIIINGIVSIIVALVVIVVAYIMAGGRITS